MSMRKPTMAQLGFTIIAWEDQAKIAKQDKHHLFTEQFCNDTAQVARDLMNFRLQNMPEEKWPKLLNIVNLQMQFAKEKEELND